MLENNPLRGYHLYQFLSPISLPFLPTFFVHERLPDYKESIETAILSLPRSID
jgi:hypothetical protein